MTDKQGNSFYYIQSKDPHSRELEEKLKDIPACPGVCFFFDIVNSTAIKYEIGVEKWAKMINNTFNFISFLNDFPDNVVKGIGDEIMLYIPYDQLRNKSGINSYKSLIEEIYATLDNIKNYPVDHTFLHCKVAIHHCTDVYNITFFENANDYYGKDIDLTARLMSKTKENRIVISEAFYSQLKEELSKEPLVNGSSCIHHISEKETTLFKGVPKPVGYRTLDV